MPQAGPGKRSRQLGPQKAARADGEARATPPSPTPHRVAHRCCSPTSPSAITCGTSSCVGHSPELMHPNTPHSSRIPNSSSSMSPEKARGGSCRRHRCKGLSTNQLPARPERLSSRLRQPLPSQRLNPRYCGGARSPESARQRAQLAPATLCRLLPARRGARAEGEAWRLRGGVRALRGGASSSLEPCGKLIFRHVDFSVIFQHPRLGC